MSIKHRVAIFEKNGMFCAMALTQLENGTLMGSYDKRNSPPPIRVAYAEYGAPQARSFDGQLIETEENGWRRVWDGNPGIPADYAHLN